MFKNNESARSSRSLFFAQDDDAIQKKSALTVFIDDVYRGKFGVHSTEILEQFEHHPSRPMVAVNQPDYKNVDFLLLKLLSIGLQQVHLQNDCHEAHCSEINLSQKHTVIEHLKQLFFVWAQQNYALMGLPDLTQLQDDYSKISKLFIFLLKNCEVDLRENLSLQSILATLYVSPMSFR